MAEPIPGRTVMASGWTTSSGCWSRCCRHVPAGVHVVGHSYGGVVALHLALAGRVPIRSLTLIEPVAFFLLPHAGAQAAWLEIQDLGQTYAARIAAGETQMAL